MLTLTEDELARLRADLLELIADRAADLVDGADLHAWLTAALTVDAGLSAVAGAVSAALDERARAAGMTLDEIARARGITKQAVHRRVNRQASRPPR